MAVCLAALILGRPLVDAGYRFPDSQAYVDWPSDFVLVGPTRVMGARPVGYALFLALFGTGTALVWAQTVLSFAAWSWLGWVAGRLPGTLLGCALALAPPLWRWNASVLSESCSLSLMALALAVALVYARRAAAGEHVHWRIRAAWAACAVLLGWSRDANLVLVPALLLPAAYVRPRQALALLALVLVVLGVGALDSRRNDRSQWSLTNAIIGRVLPDADAVARFQAAGMPVSPALLEAAGSPGRRTQRRLRETEPEFCTWVASHGSGVYWRWVVTRGESYAEAWRALQEFFARDLPKYPARMRLPEVVERAARILALGPSPRTTLLLPLFLLPAWLLERRIRPALLAALLASAVALVYAFLCYHADAVEVQRHMLLGLVLQRTAFLVGVGALLALLVAALRRRNLVAAERAP